MAVRKWAITYKEEGKVSLSSTDVWAETEEDARFWWGYVNKDRCILGIRPTSEGDATGKKSASPEGSVPEIIGLDAISS